MTIQTRTIQKLMREDFPGTNPLVVEPAERDKVAADLKARLERLDGVDATGHYHVRPEDKPRFVYAFAIHNPEAYYYHSLRIRFRLQVDEENRLTIQEAHGSHSAMVGDLEEVVTFVRHCKQQLDRQKALRTKRSKVRDLYSQAILAHVRKLAKVERFDFMSESDAQKLNLFIKMSKDQSLVLPIPFKNFKDYLPHLQTAIVSLRQLYQKGIRFQLVGRAGLPSSQSWTTHQSLAKEDKKEPLP